MISFYLKIPENFVCLILSLVCMYYFLHGQIWIFSKTPCGLPSSPNPVSSDTLFELIYCIRLFYDWSFCLNHHITYICYFVASIEFFPSLCTLGPTCAVKKDVHKKKKYSNSKGREDNIAVVYYSAMIAATRKVHFSCVFLLPSSWWWRGVGESWLLTHACYSRLGRMGRGLGTFDSLFLKPAFNFAKISLLVFFYRDFGEQIEDPRMFDVTSETRDNTSVIILKSRLTLQVILPARDTFTDWRQRPSVILCHFCFLFIVVL